MMKSIQRTARPIKALERISPHLERAKGTRIFLILRLPQFSSNMVPIVKFSIGDGHCEVSARRTPFVYNAGRTAM